MTQDQFHSWLDDTSSMNTASIPQLREVIQRYPYFQTAQVLLAKNLRKENHIDQLNQLQLAAVMVPDRKILHDYLNDIKRPKTEISVIVEEEKQIESPVEIEKEAQPESVEVKHESLYDLIPEPIIYQLETADLPELAPQQIEEEAEPEELSFSEWLAFTDTGRSVPKRTEAKEVKKAKTQPSLSNFELIDHFLSQQADQPKKRAEFFNPQKAGAKSLEEDFTVVSETLANIYFQQEKYELARQSYEALSLKYPEKSIYFAARLKEIDEKLNSE